MTNLSMKLKAALAVATLAVAPVLAAEEEKPQTSVDAAKGGFTVKSGDNSLTFGGMHFNSPREVYGEVRYRFHY